VLRQASKWHRFAVPLAGFLLAVSLAGCAAPQSADSAMLSVVYNHAPDTFDVDAVTNAAHDAIFLVVVHCTTACYGKYRTEIEASMSSVSAVSLVPAPPMWAGLVGR